jgi:hypothetical protein
MQEMQVDEFHVRSKIQINQGLAWNYQSKRADRNFDTALRMCKHKFDSQSPQNQYSTSRDMKQRMAASRLKSREPVNLAALRHGVEGKLVVILPSLRSPAGLASSS